MTDSKQRTSGVFEAIDRAVAVCGRLFAWTGGALILLIALLVAGDVVSRNLNGTTPFHAFELSAYLFAAAIAFGFANTLTTGGNIRLDVVYGLFPARVRRGLDFSALAAMAAMSILLAVYAWRLVAANAERGVTSATGMAVPIAVPQGIWALGLTVFAVTAGWLTLRHGMFLAARNRGAADRIGAIGTSESDEALAEARARNETTGRAA